MLVALKNQFLVLSVDKIFCVPLRLCVRKNSVIVRSRVVTKTFNNNTTWGKILNIVITILTAIATTFGTASCM